MASDDGLPALAVIQVRQHIAAGNLDAKHRWTPRRVRFTDDQRVRLAAKAKRFGRRALVGERSLRPAIAEFVSYYHYERNHQGRDNQLLIFDAATRQPTGPVACQARLGGLLKYYHRRAA